MEYDLHNSVLQAVALSITDGAITSNTTTVGAVIDTLGFESLEFIVEAGTLTDGDYDVVLQEDDTVGFASPTTISSELVLGALPSFAFASGADSAQRVGTIAKERFIRLSVVSTNVTTGGGLSAVAVLSNPHTSPTAAA